MEADGPSDTKSRRHTEGAAKAVQAMYGNSFSANRVNPDPMCLISFGVKAELSAPPCRGEVLVENGAAVPKSCLSPLEMRSPTAAGGLFPAGMVSTATRYIFHQLPLWFCMTEETFSRTSNLYLSYFSISGWINNQQPPSWPRSLKQNRGKIWCLIQAGRQVVSVPARFWERGARCFVGRLSFWSGWWRSAAFFGGRLTRES